MPQRGAIYRRAKKEDDGQGQSANLRRLRTEGEAERGTDPKATTMPFESDSTDCLHPPQVVVFGAESIVGRACLARLWQPAIFCYSAASRKYLDSSISTELRIRILSGQKVPRLGENESK